MKYFSSICLAFRTKNRMRKKKNKIGKKFSKVRHIEKTNIVYQI